MALTDSLIEYPSDFPIKVLGLSHQGFAQAVAEVVMRYDHDFDAATMEMRPSSGARYIGLTCTVRATFALTMKSARVMIGGIRRSW
jgi:putative lipoic acid-binding regulatory protein